MNKMVSDEKDGSLQIIKINYNNLGMKHQVCTYGNKETFEQTNQI